MMNFNKFDGKLSYRTVTGEFTDCKVRATGVTFNAMKMSKGHFMFNHCVVNGRLNNSTVYGGVNTIFSNCEGVIFYGNYTGATFNGSMKGCRFAKAAMCRYEFSDEQLAEMITPPQVCDAMERFDNINSF